MNIKNLGEQGKCQVLMRVQKKITSLELHVKWYQFQSDFLTFWVFWMLKFFQCKGILVSNALAIYTILA